MEHTEIYNLLADHRGHEIYVEETADACVVWCDSCGIVLFDHEDIDFLLNHVDHEVEILTYGSEQIILQCNDCEGDVLIEGRLK